MATLDDKISDFLKSPEEEFSESFNCCVCLDLLYKPIVLACGHVSCFWCVHKSMDGFRESTCPICRHPYYHFPTICQMLHFLLLKMYPVAYERREKQVLEDEKKMNCFSPQLARNSSGLHTDQGMANQKDSTDVSASSYSDHLSLLHSSTCELDNDAILSQSVSSCPLQDSVRNRSEDNIVSPRSSNGACNQPLVADLLCAACKQLLYCPTVLNCGHVFCETCIVVPEDEVIICQVCQCPHPSDLPNVFLELSYFLEEVFPKEYALRREEIKDKEVQLKRENQPTGSTRRSEKGSKSYFLSDGWWSEHGSKVHLGVGCDYCGMYPIVGNRYQCQDCVEKIGFDLCGDCYTTGSKLPGRFNQQHTPDHKFKLMKQPRNTVLRLVATQQEDGSLVSVISTSGTEDSDDDSSLDIESGGADADEATTEGQNSTESTT